MKKILFTILPVLNDEQQEALLFLFKGLEKENYKCVVWMSSALNEKLKPYTSETDNALFKPLSIFSKIQGWFTLRRLRHKVWKERYQRWRSAEAFEDIQGDYRLLTLQSYQILAGIKPDYFFCWNNMCSLFGIANEIARILKINTRVIEWGYLPNSIYFDLKGAYGFAELRNTNPIKLPAPDQELYEEMGQHIYSSIKELDLGIYKQETQDTTFLFNDGFKKRLLILGIDETDSNIYPVDYEERKVHLPFHHNCYELAQDFATRLPDCQVIYKPHPSRNVHKETKKISENFWVVNSEPNALIDLSDAVVCFGSKMEISVLLRNKPLIVFDSGLLGNKDCGYVIQRMDDLNSIVEQAYLKGVTAEQIRALKIFAGYIYYHSLFVFSDTALLKNNRESFVNHFKTHFLEG